MIAQKGGLIAIVAISDTYPSSTGAQSRLTPIGEAVLLQLLLSLLLPEDCRSILVKWQHIRLMNAVVWNATAATLLPKEVVAWRHYLIRSARAVVELQRAVAARTMTPCHALR